MGLFTVYKHTSPSGKVYIGITSRPPEKRWQNGFGYSKQDCFYKAIRKHGWENFTHEILFSGLSKGDACKKEIELIEAYRSNEREYGYNRSTGGENPAQGSPLSEEAKLKISKANKGKAMSEKTKAILSAQRKGKPNGREGKIGAACSHAGVVYQIEEDTHKVVAKYYGYDEMHRLTGFAKTPVKETVSGKRKRAYGYLWEYQKRGLNNVSI